MNYWVKFPPVHILLRMFVGYEPKEMRLATEDEVKSLVGDMKRAMKRS